jgi:protein-tyrosine-phosphatase
LKVPTEAKPFASLSSGLLARKGAARPAMRPQGFGQVGNNGLEDLGWNDMGFEPPKAAEAERDDDHDAFGDDVVEHSRVHPTGLTPVGSPVHDQQAEIVERFSVADEAAGAEEADEQEFKETDELAEIDEADAEEAPAPSPVMTKPAARPVVVATAAFVPAPRTFVRPRVAPGTKAKAAFTLRLDTDRHLKLRLACAVDGRSAQQLVTDALDQLLERMPDLDGLAQKAKRGGNTNESSAP